MLSRYLCHADVEIKGLKMANSDDLVQITLRLIGNRANALKNRSGILRERKIELDRDIVDADQQSRASRARLQHIEAQHTAEDGVGLDHEERRVELERQYRVLSDQISTTEEEHQKIAEWQEVVLELIHHAPLRRLATPVQETSDGQDVPQVEETSGEQVAASAHSPVEDPGIGFVGKQSSAQKMADGNRVENLSKDLGMINLNFPQIFTELTTSDNGKIMKNATLNKARSNTVFPAESSSALQSQTMSVEKPIAQDCDALSR